MLISDTIAEFINEMLDNCGGTLEIKRNDLAKRLGCVPSQINYVVSSRFTPERGYLIESRRGGGGYIRIVRKVVGGDELLNAIFAGIGDTLDETGLASLSDTLYGADLITARERRMLRAVASNKALEGLPRQTQNTLRASICRNYLLSLL